MSKPAALATVLICALIAVRLLGQQSEIEAARMRGDWARAAELLNEAIDVTARLMGTAGPEVAALLSELAAAWRALGQIPEAIAALELAVYMRGSIAEFS